MFLLCDQCRLRTGGWQIEDRRLREASSDRRSALPRRADVDRREQPSLGRRHFTDRRESERRGELERLERLDERMTQKEKETRPC
jgi:hypothetical protein